MDSDHDDRVPPLTRDDLEVTDHGEYLELKFTGRFSAGAAMKVVDRMVAACVDAGRAAVLLDCRRMEGPLTVADRFEVAEYGAQVIHPHIGIAMLARADHMLPDNFFETVAVSRGVRVKVFTEPDEALAWLSTRG